MSDIEKAARDAVDAARNSEQLALITAVLQAQQLGQQQCQHGHQAPAARSSWSPGKVAAVAAGGSVLAISLAVSIVAVAIGTVSLTVCLLILRQVWTDMQKKGGK